MFINYLRNVLGEGFKEIAVKFNKEVDDVTVKKYMDKYKLLKERNKIKGVEADIDSWSKKTWNDFKTFVDSFDETKIKSRNEVKKEAYKNVVAENDEYVIIKIHNAEDAYALGKGTVWCIASGEKPMAELHYDEYSKDSDFYFAIKKNMGEISKIEVNRDAVVGDGDNEGKKYSEIYPYSDKIAIQVKSDGDIDCWNTGDFKFSFDKLKSFGINLPDYEFVYEFKLPSGWIKTKEGYTIENDYVPIDKSGDVVYRNLPKDTKLTVNGDFRCVFRSGTIVSEVVWPVKVYGDVEINSSYIKNFENQFPKYVRGDIVIDCESIEELGSMPKVVKSLRLINCYYLKSIDKTLTEVSERFDMNNCENLNLDHLPICNGQVIVFNYSIPKENVVKLVEVYKNIKINGVNGKVYLDDMDDEDVVESWLSKYCNKNVIEE